MYNIKYKMNSDLFTTVVLPSWPIAKGFDPRRVWIDRDTFCLRARFAAHSSKELLRVSRMRAAEPYLISLAIFDVSWIDEIHFATQHWSSIRTVYLNHVMVCRKTLVEKGGHVETCFFGFVSRSTFSIISHFVAASVTVWRCTAVALVQ